MKTIIVEIFLNLFRTDLIESSSEDIHSIIKISCRMKISPLRNFFTNLQEKSKTEFFKRNSSSIIHEDDIKTMNIVQNRNNKDHWRIVESSQRDNQYHNFDQLFYLIFKSTEYIHSIINNTSSMTITRTGSDITNNGYHRPLTCT